MHHNRRPRCLLLAICAPLLLCVVPLGANANEYPTGWAVPRAKARTVLQRFGYKKQATFMDPGGKAYFVLQRSHGRSARVAERYIGPNGKQWVLTATGKGYAGPRQGRHDIEVAPTSGQRVFGPNAIRVEVGNLGLQPAPRRWDRPLTREDAVPSLFAKIKLPDGQTHRATLERVGKNGWRTSPFVHASLGPRVSFEMDARGEIRNLAVQTPHGNFGQIAAGLH